MTQYIAIDLILKKFIQNCTDDFCDSKGITQNQTITLKYPGNKSYPTVLH